jgi:MFS family permease
MLKAAVKVPSILIAIFVMMIGSGYLSTLITLRLQDSGANAVLIAGVTAAYFAGLTLGSLRAPRVINRVGHIRGFAAFVSLYSATTLIYPLLDAAWLWIGLRFIDGICVAAVFICLESWLNERADDQSRGSIIATYMVALYVGQAVGQQFLNLAPAQPALPFLIASIPISLSIIPLALTRLSGPVISEQLPISVPDLYAASPLGFVGALTSGVILGAFYGLGAVFARRIGLSVADTAAFMSFVIVGGVALQWPLGRLSDIFERRRVIVSTIAGCVAVTALLALASQRSTLFVSAALFGGLSFALYPLSVAHTNDHLTPSQRLGAAGALVLIYSAGAAVGPLLAGAAMRAFGPSGLFFSMCGCCGAALLFAVWRQIARGPVPADLQQPYRNLPRTTPAATTIEPAAVTAAADPEQNGD